VILNIVGNVALSGLYGAATSVRGDFSVNPLSVVETNNFITLSPHVSHCYA
jgi:hypothetical protein